MNRKQLEQAIRDLLPRGSDMHLGQDRCGQIVVYTDTYWDDVAGVLKPMRAQDSDGPDDM